MKEIIRMEKVEEETGQTRRVKKIKERNAGYLTEFQI
jgi:hypothetical protein